jgi:hypothetical protein
MYATASGVAAFVDPIVLQQRFTELMQKMTKVFSASATAAGEYSVDEIQLHLSLTAEGSFGIIASGTMGAESGITVVLKRPAPSKR